MRSHFRNTFLGNLLEHYDTALFGFLSPFLAPIIFPKHDPVVALILTYAMMPISMLARPLGAFVFGLIGDLRGRCYVLFITMMGMGVISLFMALIPSYQQIGIFSAVLFCVGRFLQNFFASGETMTGAVFLMENTKSSNRDLISSCFNMSSIGGYILPSFGVYLLSYMQVIDFGWRLLYLFGFSVALFGVFLRKGGDIEVKKLSFYDALSHAKTSLTKHFKPFLEIVIVSGFACCSASMALVLVNGLVPLVTTVSKIQIMQINSYLLIFDFLIMPLFGWLCSKYSREKIMLASSLFCSVFAIPLFASLEGASLASVIIIRIILVVIGVSFFASFHAWAKEKIPQSSRTFIVSLGYGLGNLIFAGPAAMISMWLYQSLGSSAYVAVFWVFCALLSSFVLIKEMVLKKIEFLQR